MRVLALLAAFGLATFGWAEEKKKVDLKLPEGAFSKKAGDFEISWEFKGKDKLIFKMVNGGDGCTLEAKVKHDKGNVKATTEKFEKTGNFPFEKEKGYEFSFKWKMDGKKFVITDLEGNDIDDQARQTVGGEYEPVSK